MSGTDAAPPGVNRPDILHGDDAPGGWSHRTVGGKIITWSLPVGVSIEGFDTSEGQCVELVLEKQGEYGDENRSVTVWVVAYDPDYIINNCRELGQTIGEADGLESAAELAVDFMQEHPGNRRQKHTE